MSSSSSRSTIAPVRSKGTVRRKQPIAEPRFSFSASNAVITCSAVTPISPTSKRIASQQALWPRLLNVVPDQGSCHLHREISDFIEDRIVIAWHSSLVMPHESILCGLTLRGLKAQSGFGAALTSFTTGNRELRPSQGLKQLPNTVCRRGGQPRLEAASVPRFATHVHRSVMVTNDFVHSCEAQSSSRQASREERLKQSSRHTFVEAVPGIADRQAHIAAR